MSIVIAVVNQSLPGGPLCAMTVDSCQTRIRDPYDPSKNEYFLDVNKIHQFGNFLIAECGNPHGFAQYWRMAEGMRIAGGGIDYFMDRSAEIMQIVGRDWYRSYRQRWPDLPAEHTRRYSRTIAVIAGWSRRRGRIVMRAISDDPAQQAAMDGDGFIVSGGAPETRAPLAYIGGTLGVLILTPAPWVPAAWRDAIRWARLRDAVPRAVVPLCAAGCAAIGLLVYSTFIYRLTNRPFTWLRAHQAWGRIYEGLDAMVARTYTHVSGQGVYEFSQSVPVDSMNAAACLLALAALWPVTKRYGPAFGLFIAAGLPPFRLALLQLLQARLDLSCLLFELRFA